MRRLPPIHFVLLSAVLPCALVLVPLISSAQAPGDVDPTFNVDNLANSNNRGAVVGVASAKVLQFRSDGTLWTGGFDFWDDSYVGRLCRFHPDGSLDATYYSTVAPIPDCIVEQADGKVLVAADYIIRRTNVDGTWDQTFTSSPNGPVNDLEIQSDGKPIVFGSFGTYNGTDLVYDGIVRVNADGTIDPTFMAGIYPFTWGSTTFSDAVIRADGDIVATGDFEINVDNGPHPTNFIVLNPDGSRDPVLSPSYPGLVGGTSGKFVPWPEDNKLLLFNSGTQYEGQSVSRIFLLDSLLNLDPLVLPTLGDTVHQHIAFPALDCAVYPDGRMLFAGLPPPGAPLDHVPLVRVFPNGNVDTTFHPGDLFNGPFPARIESVTLGDNGNIYCTGPFNRENNGAYRNGFMRLDSLGNLDEGFTTGNGFNGVVLAIEQLLDGRYVVGGDFTTYRGRRCRGIACLTSNGELDTTFQVGTGFRGPQPSPFGLVTALAVQPDGRILVAGDFESYNGTARLDLLRLEPDGTLDASFDPFGPGSTYLNAYAPRDVAVQADGRVLVSGPLEWSGYAAEGIARFLPDGTRDTSFDHGTGFSSGPNSLSIQPSGKIVCGGEFTSYGGAPCEYRCCRLNANGSLDGTFTIPGSLVINFEVMQVLSQPDGKVLLSGPFNYIGGHVTYNIGRMNANGSPDVSFAAPWGAGTPFVLQADGRIISASAEYDGVLQQGVVRLLSNSDWDASFGQPDATWNVLTDDVVTCLLIDDAERVLVGGDFRRMRGQGANGLVRLFTDFNTDLDHNDAAADRLQVWPNPGTGAFTISLPWIGTTDQAVVEVVNAMGQRVHTGRIGRAKGQLPLDLSQNAAGTYTVRVIDEWGIATARVIRE